jgi:iron complex outermembrane recepter protein
MRKLTFLLLLGTAAPTWAQATSEPASVQSDAASEAQPGTGQPNASTGDGEQGIGDIVITANRVASTAQTTPISLTAYTGEDLAAAGVASVATLQTVDPSVNFTQRTGSGFVAVRGIASTDVTEIGDPSVPIARDGFFTNRGFSINTSFYDIARIEVLKGPQGTLFGRNSTGGLISIITRRPGDELGGNFSLELGNYDTVNAEAGVDLPVSEFAELRFSGISRRHKGYRRLLVLGGRGDDDNTVSGKAQLELLPFDGLTALVSYQHDEVDAVGDVFLSTPLGQLPPEGFDAKAFANFFPSSNFVRGDRIRWEAVYDRLPGHLSLTYAGGFDKQRWRHAIDATDVATLVRQQFLNSESPDTWNHEVRLATDQSGALTGQVGYFHFREENTLDNGLLVRSGRFADRYLIRFNYDVRTQSDAVFGQVGYRPVSEIKLSAGARYTWDKKDRTGNAVLDLQVASGGFLPPIQITTPGDGSVRQSKPTFHAGIDWTPTSRNLLYAKFDTGYKSGGFNSNGQSASIDYGPENLKAWEIGTKNRFHDNKLLLNLTGFYQDYSGYQASQSNPAISSGQGVFNIGAATIYGVEGQVIALAGKLRMDVNGTYLHAQFADDVGSILSNDPVTGGALVRSVAGNDLPNAPRLAVSAGMEYPIGFGSGELTFRVDGKYSSSYYFDVFNDADTRQKAYATGNLSATYTTGPYTIQAFVRNFTDKVVFANAQRNFTGGSNNYQFQPPRTFGVRLGFDF